MAADADLLRTALRHAQEVIHHRTSADLAGQLTALEARFSAWPVVGSARLDPPVPPAAGREARLHWQGWEQRLVLAGVEERLGRGSS